MTKEERHEMIMEALIKHGSVLVSDLVTTLDVSAVTVRKDLTELEKSDKLYRSHGKAVLINPYINNRSVNEKEKLAADEKHAIGREAARLIDERFVAYSKKFSAARLNSEEIMSMVALDIAFKHVKLQRGIDIEPVEKTLQSLISDLEDFNRTR